MSIVLDALRMGRGGPGKGLRSTPAQTDAILQTLGYARSSSSPLDRLKRFVVYLGVSLVFAGLLWAAVIGLARLYVARDPGRAASGIEQVASRNGKVIFFPDAPVKRP